MGTIVTVDHRLGLPLPGSFFSILARESNSRAGTQSALKRTPAPTRFNVFPRGRREIDFAVCGPMNPRRLPFGSGLDGVSSQQL
jgi:hypothetical protein